MTKKEIQGSGKEINPTLLEKEKMDNAFTKMMLGQKRIKEAYCSYETAKLLKEKGFDESIHTWYNIYDGIPTFTEGYIKISNVDFVANDEDCFSAPTHQMACAWCRDKGYHIYTFKGVDSWVYEVQSLNEDWTYHLGSFEDHDDAIEAALKYTLENLI